MPASSVMERHLWREARGVWTGFGRGLDVPQWFYGVLSDFAGFDVILQHLYGFLE